MSTITAGDDQTLSGLELRPQTMRDVAQAKAAMERFGLEVPAHVTMMLEVIGRESEKGQAEYESLSKFMSKQLLNSTPLQAGTDFEFHLYPQSPEDKAKAEAELDKIAFAKIRETFHDVSGIDRLEQDTVTKLMETWRNMRLGDAHNAKSFEVLKQILTTEGFGLGNDRLDNTQYRLLETLCDGYGEHHQKLEHICGNLLYPGDLVLEKLFQQQQASGQLTIEPDWEPGKRHEVVSDSIVKANPEMASYGRFEMATAFEGASPLEMITRYYDAQAQMLEITRELAQEQGIHFEPPRRMVDHVHMSDQKNMVLDSDAALKKASGIVNVTKAMVATLADGNAFNRDTPASSNMIHVDKIGYASDNRSSFQEQRSHALRGVADDEHSVSSKGHLEFRLGNPKDPFNIVYMTAAMAGGMNMQHRLDAETIEATQQAYEHKKPLAVVGQMDFRDAFTDLVHSPMLDFMPEKVRHAVFDAKLEALSPERREAWDAYVREASGPQYYHSEDKLEGRYHMTDGSIVSVPALAEGSEVRGGAALVVSNEPLSRKSVNFTESGEGYAPIMVVPEARREQAFKALEEAGRDGRDIMQAMVELVQNESKAKIYPRAERDVTRLQQAVSSGQLRSDTVSFPVRQY